jgi:hypothetical protein
MNSNLPLVPVNSIALAVALPQGSRYTIYETPTLTVNIVNKGPYTQFNVRVITQK